MSLYNLEKIFKAESVAIIGASNKPATIGNILVNNLFSPVFKGKVFAVNPRSDSILGHKSYPSIKEVPEPVDLAVIATPISSAPAIVQECVETGVGGAVIISAGGKEVGQEGRKIEARLKEEAEKGGLRIIGPNCMGIMCVENGLNATFAAQQPLSGKLAFISQSGAVCSAVLDLSLQKDVGLRYFVSTGSMLDVDFGDLINYLGGDPDVSSIILYMESVTNSRKFMSAARAVSMIKPIVVLKSGRSKAGAKAASSHTGALAGEDAVYDAAFKRAGIVRVDTVEELFDCAELMAKQSLPTGKGLAVLTNGGGPGVMAADAAAFYGIDPVTLAKETIEKLDKFLPAFWSKGNPIDMIGDATPDRWRQALDVCLHAKEINGLVVIYVPQPLSEVTTVARIIADMIRDKSHPPIFAVWMGGKDAQRGRNILNEAGVPTYDTPERAVSAFKYMSAYAHNLEMSHEIPRRLKNTLEFDNREADGIIAKALREGSGFLSEWESKRVLNAYGIPCTPTEPAGTSGEAVRLARKMGYPVVMKVLSPDIIHKTNAGGVLLGLKSDRDVEEAFERILDNARNYDPKAEIRGVTIQPMLGQPDYELILGSKKDSFFGPIILFGMGGIMAEVLEDRTIAIPPLNRLLAKRLLEGTKVSKMLKGYRNRPGANMELLEEILIRLSQLVIDFPEIIELDINPLITAGAQCIAADARIMVKPSAVPSPEHLVISPYPEHYEMQTTTSGGLKIFVRPIKPEDAPLLVDLFNSLSRQSVYYRFFSPMKSLPPDMLARFTQIDYGRDMALVALDVSSSSERMVGVSRLMSDPDGKRAEFSVVVGDPWQGKGIGVALAEALLNIARKRGIECLWGMVLAENTQMLTLGKHLGFSISRDVPSDQYKLEIDLKSVRPRHRWGTGREWD
jgi:acetyltransferase